MPLQLHMQTIADGTNSAVASESAAVVISITALVSAFSQVIAASHN
jgi:hypothetical protein